MFNSISTVQHIIGPNSTWLCLMQFMPVTCAINAIAAMLLIIQKAKIRGKTLF